MNEIKTECGNVPVAVAARVLKLDRQTVRLLIQNKIVDWGICYKNPKSTHYSYIIYPLKFYQATGYLYKGGK
jgi:hypothetical protein